MATNVPVTLDTLIVVKVQFQEHTKKFKIPLRDLGAQVLPDKLRTLLRVDPNDELVLERYSDSVGAYVTLDSNKPQIYKTLFRAAKAKLKLRLKATISGQEIEQAPPSSPAPAQESVTSHSSSLKCQSLETLTPNGAAQVAPIIARSPISPSPLFTSSKLDAEARTSPISPLMSNKADTEGEAPLPQSIAVRQSFFSGLTNASGNADLAFRPKVNTTQCSWVVYCNNCNLPMEDEHFHCSICDHGDYDLCSSCVNSGTHCPGSGHWMVKRFIKNGSVVNSTTERVGPKPKPENVQEMPGAFASEKQPVVYEEQPPTRTCNCCVKVFPEKEFVTCIYCKDYDLCMECHTTNRHGHHPGHGFKPATHETVLSALAVFLCNPGRNVRHSAVCDGCEKFIYGVRHKCLNCPDFDFCGECMKLVKYIHPRHRFVPIYEPLAEPVNSANSHHGIYCDGPLCRDNEIQSYIEGIRYKCAVCHDTDFCANCEAHPCNRHNHTHPLIKLKHPVRSVSVTTLNEDVHGKTITQVGDRVQPARKSTATETTPVTSAANVATQVRTIVDMQPAEVCQPKTTKEKIEIRDLLAEPIQEKTIVQDPLSAPNVPASEVKPMRLEPFTVPKSEELDAHFVRDTIPDGSKISSGSQFVQAWTVRNPGPKTWPAGCSVRYVGGDNMLNIDNSQCLSQSELAEATESNVVDRSVESGEEISFRVIMKAPKREGTAISYWRLKAPDGIPFGHRLWCDIQVVSPPLPTPSAEPEPVTAPALTPSTWNVEASGSHTAKPAMTPYELFQQAKLERLQSLQRPQAQTYTRHEKCRDENNHHIACLHEEALERLRKMKLQGHDNQEQTRLEKLEREKMHRIQRVRKATVERLLETRRREREASCTPIHHERVSQPICMAPVQQETAELPVEEKTVEHRPEAQASSMIFPQLDKESPASSTHEAATTEPVYPKSELSNIAATVSDNSEDEFFEDAESVEIRSITSGDEGFMTDEDYDILDASDEEMP